MSDVTLLAAEARPERAAGNWTRGRPYVVYALPRLGQAVIVILLAAGAVLGSPM